MEEQILLRVPPEVAKRLTEMIDEGRAAAASSSSASAASAASPVSLAFTSDRRALLTYDGQAYDATLVDLPCHIETHKTWDGIAFYKTADIAQMLTLHAAVAQPNAAAAAAAQQQQTAGLASAGPGGAGKEEKKDAAAAAAASAVALPPIRSPSGLLPPTRDIRPKRYDRETVVPRKIVTDVETMLQHIRDATPIHTFKLIEEELEVEVDEDEEWEEEDEPRAAPAPGATSQRPTSASSVSSNGRASPAAPIIRINSEQSLAAAPASASSTRPSSAALSSSHPSSLLTPALSPNLLASASPSFSPAFADADEEKMRDATEMEDVVPLPSPKQQPEEQQQVAEEAGKGERRESEGKAEQSQQSVKEQEAAGGQAADAAAARVRLLAQELQELDRRIAELSAQVDRQLNRLIKKREMEKLAVLEEERASRQREMDTLRAPPAPSQS